MTFKPWQLILLVSLFIAITGNAAFFHGVLEIYPWSEHSGFLISVGVVFTLLVMLLASLFGLLLSIKFTLSLFLIIAAVTGYYADALGVIVDKEMINNALQTNAAEAADVITGGMIMRLLLLGVLPTIFVWRVRLSPQTLWSRLKRMLVTIGVTVAVAGASFWMFSAQYYSAGREHKNLRYRAIPIYPLYSAIRMATKSLKSPPPKFKVLTEHAITPVGDEDRELVIVVVGETVRADHFSLMGYKRETTPLLAKEPNVVAFQNITSCGTSTAVSVPCMFSFSDREDYSSSEKHTQNAIDVLAKAGVNVLWLDNNSSSKGVADRVEYYDYRTAATNTVCDDVECRDIGMLKPLQKYIDSHKGDILIVLHQMGNHGPAYYKRYPAEFERFKPACQTAELADCSAEEISNAYDNAILYTDYFLSEVIALLKRNSDEFETVMLYMGDHGESLGEGGVYLHGLPYMFAPEAQTHVPLIFWNGESSDFDIEAFRQHKDAPSSHDSLAPFLMQAFEIESDLVSKLRSPSYVPDSAMKPEPEHHGK
ncbi:phosphoethanolamine transferase [Magnetofaba australis]|nr:phosphoethanolamine--lipid A transferase [Magnetofaba australis]